MLFLFFYFLIVFFSIFNFIFFTFLILFIFPNFLILFLEQLKKDLAAATADIEPKGDDESRDLQVGDLVEIKGFYFLIIFIF